MGFSLSDDQKHTLPWLIAALLLIGLLVLLGPMLTPFFTAGILAYALNPGVDRLARQRIGGWKLPRVVAVAIVMLVFILALLAIVLVVVPIIGRELPLLRDLIPKLLDRLNTVLAPRLEDFGIQVRLDGSGVMKMLTRQMATSSEEIWSSVFASVRTGGTAILGWLSTLLFIPMALFYLLLDWHVFLQRIERLIPRRWTAKVRTLAVEVDQLLAQYLRGQLLVMLILAIYYSAALAVAGFDIALPVGIVTGLLVFIPFVGYGLGLTLALVAAVLQFSGWYGLIAVAVIYGVGQVLESFILTPMLVGERIGLHPLVVIFALLAFGQLFGFTGVLLALPASAAMSVMVKHVKASYLSSPFYNA
ncbi:AI-2E family transporter [Herbaspirillum sp. RTI4]|uniref:AI-2E family transporter n=1 Tax=Herbaspirillum sp. RTI4 TaxID=3048640 RepID=UPI002AB56427|nr:AI-2E family transporter [Herbaspirillum sp. RTI4]MDY7576841.1 AI-2E family transporter [Herbaspirillum sp. RTI4]MEA9983358.1 AI-2E family transporter [Herbaspirillum sp. RTI4]